MRQDQSGALSAVVARMLCIEHPNCIRSRVQSPERPTFFPGLPNPTMNTSKGLDVVIYFIHDQQELTYYLSQIQVNARKVDFKHFL